MSDSPGIRAITLDVDGTLYSIRSMLVRNPLAMMSMMDFFRDLHRVRDEMRGREPSEDFRAEQARRLAKARGLSQEQAARQVEEVIDRRWMKVFSKVQPYRGVRQALQNLARRGIKLGLLSDYPISAKLDGIGLSDLPFDAMVVSEQVGALKPHPASFVQAARVLGVEPRMILHVGDKEDCDVEGALAAGMRAALFHRGRKAPVTRAEIVFSDWRKFVSLLNDRRLIAPDLRSPE